MVLEYWAQRQQKQGNEDAAKKARDLVEEYGDVPLPPILTLPSKEQQKEVPRLSQEALQGLEKEGYLTYELGGQSIRSLKEQGRRFNSDWHKGNLKFEALISKKSQVAINPKQLFLQNSNRKTYGQQEEMVKEFSEELSRRIPGIEAIIGEASDYIELAFRHLDETSERLFGEKYEYYYTRTKTPIEGPFLAIVGYFNAKTSIDVKRCHRDDDGANNVWVCPLVVPRTHARVPT